MSFRTDNHILTHNKVLTQPLYTEYGFFLIFYINFESDSIVR